ncbi:SCO family protein [Nocardioides marmorisolisilvae]|uniref:SCO family protein n=1 Tax=Nocardioides marmorisolisilvae TaxID=1542737 RepID=A0A3N0DVP2_9ACTN|nr:SCO family protein [Nocardioides marmorisolisilvae]RNL79674.1 SCO family protein [Nocardioides marmorisolisilvae]
MVDARRVRLGVAGIVAGALLLTGCGGGGGNGVTISTPGNHGYHGIYLDEAYQLPATELTDTAGKPFSLASQKAPVKIVFFGYSHCPDICQIVMSTIASALAKLDAKQRAEVQVSFVTTDPARDTEKVLRTYLDRFNPSFVGLTAPLARIDAAGKPLHVSIEDGQKLPSGGYEVEHSTYAYGAVGSDVRVIWDQDTSPRSMATDIIKLLKTKETA